MHSVVKDAQCPDDLKHKFPLYRGWESELGEEVLAILEGSREKIGYRKAFIKRAASCEKLRLMRDPFVVKADAWQCFARLVKWWRPSAIEFCTAVVAAIICGSLSVMKIIIHYFPNRTRELFLDRPAYLIEHAIMVDHEQRLSIFDQFKAASGVPSASAFRQSVTTSMFQLLLPLCPPNAGFRHVYTRLIRKGWGRALACLLDATGDAAEDGPFFAHILERRIGHTHPSVAAVIMDRVTPTPQQCRDLVKASAAVAKFPVFRAIVTSLHRRKLFVAEDMRPALVDACCRESEAFAYLLLRRGVPVGPPAGEMEDDVDEFAWDLRPFLRSSGHTELLQLVSQAMERGGSVPSPRRFFVRASRQAKRPRH